MGTSPLPDDEITFLVTKPSPNVCLSLTCITHDDRDDEGRRSWRLAL